LDGGAQPIGALPARSRSQDDKSPNVPLTAD
jgi:hypothetical protein